MVPVPAVIPPRLRTHNQATRCIPLGGDELEAAANQITDEVFSYWSQNDDLSVEFDLDFKAPSEGQGWDPPFLHVRIRNPRHRVTLEFDNRSRGFIWFFSFVAAFSEYRHKNRLIILLDEPGLSLHAAAQDDLLRYIDEQLAPQHQVIYTTHSPFMIQPGKFERVRAVEDKDEVGTIVSTDFLNTSRETLFPLQAALGVEVGQTLAGAPDNLGVEGPADVLYLDVMSAHLKRLGRTGLDPHWRLVPAGGLDKIPAFISLFGADLNVATVFDVGTGV